MTPEYPWTTSDANRSHSYLLSVVREWIPDPHSALLDLGCGNGSFTRALCQSAGTTGRVVALDGSLSAIHWAQSTVQPQSTFIDYRHHNLDTPLPEDLIGTFDVIVAVEVIEHLFFPRTLFARAREGLTSKGHLVITTPYHGYVKNLTLALFNQLDRHWDVLSDFGHIKFFSRSTLALLAAQEHFAPQDWRQVGRIRPLAKSMCVRLARGD